MQHLLGVYSLEFEIPESFLDVDSTQTGQVKYWHWTLVRVTRLITSEVPGWT